MKYFVIDVEQESSGMYGPFNTIKEAKEWLRGISLSACVLIRGTIIEKIYR